MIGRAITNGAKRNPVASICKKLRNFLNNLCQTIHPGPRWIVVKSHHLKNLRARLDARTGIRSSFLIASVPITKYRIIFRYNTDLI